MSVGGADGVRRWCEGEAIRPNDHLLDGERICNQFTLSDMDLHRRDPEYLRILPMMWAQKLLMGTLEYINKAVLPTAPEQDWGPDGSLPEYYSA